MTQNLENRPEIVYNQHSDSAPDAERTTLLNTAKELISKLTEDQLAEILEGIL